MEWKVPYSGISNRLSLEEAEALMVVLRQDTLMKGPTAQKFEQAFAKKIGVKHALATTSCTTALFSVSSNSWFEEGRRGHHHTPDLLGHNLADVGPSVPHPFC